MKENRQPLMESALDFKLLRMVIILLLLSMLSLEGIKDVEARHVKFSGHTHFSQLQKKTVKVVKDIRAQKLLGSRPPNCSFKCFGCNPCIPILVIVGPPKGSSQEDSKAVNISLDADYYPQKWMCSCGNQTYPPRRK
ncbi:hypothetical protein SUGI_0630000 [Cryptomeria japonica]|uniref:EPIDERMAL PATTERNING FACTOR-like protein 4 n=1 Tax=Cryptomeria japonica TaxID=3369 RepID=UPI002414B96B|nr:EPIDERMAL PATTERNING FACTOR-like protein 4 [Cryptomeria japonica]GLJ31398.1 hypothetical protein SUGI_0630000 [Cryptomeria japonica]